MRASPAFIEVDHASVAAHDARVAAIRDRLGGCGCGYEPKPFPGRYPVGGRGVSHWMARPTLAA